MTEDTTKPQGTWEVRRRIRIPGLSHSADGQAVERQLGALDGVRQVVADAARGRVVVRYDASEVDYLTIAAHLEAIGFPLDGGPWSRLKGGLFQFLDSNARENAHAPPPACCSKPPAGAGRPKSG